MLQQNSEGRSNKPWTWSTCWMKELCNPFACNADQHFDIKVKCSTGWASFGSFSHCMEQNWLVRVRVSLYGLISWLFHKQLQWNPDNSNSDNLNFPLTQLKSYFPWISPHFLVIFTWLTSTGISWIPCLLELNLISLDQKIHWNLPR